MNSLDAIRKEAKKIYEQIEPSSIPRIELHFLGTIAYFHDIKDARKVCAALCKAGYWGELEILDER